MNFEIRELHGDSLKELLPMLESHGVVIPFPHLAMAKVAFDENGHVAGYAIFQMVPHTEPLWVAKEYRGGELTHILAEKISDFARETAGSFVSVATNEFSEQLCREQKMEAFPGTVFVGHA